MTRPVALRAGASFLLATLVLAAAGIGSGTALGATAASITGALAALLVAYASLSAREPKLRAIPRPVVVTRRRPR